MLEPRRGGDAVSPGRSVAESWVGWFIQSRAGFSRRHSTPWCFPTHSKTTNKCGTRSSFWWAQAARVYSGKQKLMAKNFYHQWFDYFRIDVHGHSISTAQTAVKTRVEECYRYGIPFLEVVHGSGQKARERGQARRSLAHVIGQEFAHPYVVKKISLDYGLYDVGRNPTATRLCLKLNPKPLARNNNVTFRDFVADYSYIPKFSPIREPAWNLPGGDLRPFRLAKIDIDDIVEALIGWPLDRPSNTMLDSRNDFGDTLPPHFIARAWSSILGDAESVVLSSAWHRVLTASPEQFKLLRNELQQGLINGLRIAELVGCDLSFVEWAQHFSYSALGCVCCPRVTPFRHKGCGVTLWLNYVDQNGDCNRVTCYPLGAEDGVALLWNKYGKQYEAEYQTQGRAARDMALGSAVASHCFGRKCNCSSSAACRKGRYGV